MNAAARHWPEYLIEVVGLGAFMLSAATMTAILEHPASPVHALLPSAVMRRMLMGLAMGLTAMAIVYSPWGRRSGAHINPAVTLTFFRLGKISGHDAAWYACAQFIGGVLGVAIAASLLHHWIADPHVNFVATLPGARGTEVAFIAETSISFLLMLVILSASNQPRLAPFTGVIVGVLIASFITFEAPLSGMSMNPARTFGPDLVGDVWRGLWIYFVAPPLGMLAAAELYVSVRGQLAIHCAKLHHGTGPCIFCGTRRVAATEAAAAR
jgi:aquaporin Z